MIAEVIIHNCYLWVMVFSSSHRCCCLVVLFYEVVFTLFQAKELDEVLLGDWFR